MMGWEILLKQSLDNFHSDYLLDSKYFINTPKNIFKKSTFKQWTFHKVFVDRRIGWLPVG